jgi:hypothetical protein
MWELVNRILIPNGDSFSHHHSRAVVSRPHSNPTPDASDLIWSTSPVSPAPRMSTTTPPIPTTRTITSTSGSVKLTAATAVAAERFRRDVPTASTLFLYRRKIHPDGDDVDGAVLLDGAIRQGNELVIIIDGQFFYSHRNRCMNPSFRQEPDHHIPPDLWIRDSDSLIPPCSCPFCAASRSSHGPVPHRGSVHLP